MYNTSINKKRFYEKASTFENKKCQEHSRGEHRIWVKICFQTKPNSDFQIAMSGVSDPINQWSLSFTHSSIFLPKSKNPKNYNNPFNIPCFFLLRGIGKGPQSLCEGAVGQAMIWMGKRKRKRKRKKKKERERRRKKEKEEERKVLIILLINIPDDIYY